MTDRTLALATLSAEIMERMTGDKTVVRRGRYGVHVFRLPTGHQGLSGGRLPAPLPPKSESVENVQKLMHLATKGRTA